MVKDCIDHKTSLTTGGHNIMIDIIPNDIATACLNLGKTVLDNETLLVHARGRAGSILSLMPLNARPRRGGLVSETFCAGAAKRLKFAR